MNHILQSMSSTILRTAKAHPKLTLATVGVSVLVLLIAADELGTGKPLFFLPPKSPVPPGPVAPAGPLPSGTPATGITSGVTGTANLSDTFFRRVEDLAQHFRSKGATINSKDLLAMMLVESNCDPSVGNPIGCMGLNQICNLRKVGWTGTGQQYLALSAEEQLTYVQRFFDDGNHYQAIRDYGSLYLANFNPGNMGKPDNFVLYRINPNGPAVNASDSEWKTWLSTHSQPPNQDVYGLNRGVDFGKKGFIEIADMARFVKNGVTGKSKKWGELLFRLNNVVGVA